MKYQLKVNGKTYLIERRLDGYYCDDKKLMGLSNNNNKSISIEHVEIEEGQHFKVDGKYFNVGFEKNSENSSLGKEGTGVIVSPMNGIVYSVDCQLNGKVMKGDKILTIEAMKMLYPIIADKDGVITLCQLIKGQSVKSKQVLIKID
jgi:biotin carboxyl carrier protein